MASLIKNTINGVCYKKWSIDETVAYFLKGIARELKVAPEFWENLHAQSRIRNFKKKWLIKDGNISYFNIKGAKLPYDDEEISKSLALWLFDDTFLVPAFFNDNHDKSLVEKLDKCMSDGPYGYTDGKFDVTVKKGDVVIDAGAWIGDFSAYSVVKGATVYAFEPVKETFTWLCKTAELNGKSICPVQKGLSSNEGEAVIFIEPGSSGESSLVMEHGSTKETINLTTLDKFVEENKLERIDFIKADIEGAERDMLRGAINVLKKFAPKLAICTYHLPDDPEVLEKIIKEANPDYTVVHLSHKLFAAVINGNE
jgi:FkbM family methyltransferase